MDAAESALQTGSPTSPAAPAAKHAVEGAPPTPAPSPSPSLSPAPSLSHSHSPSPPTRALSFSDLGVLEAVRNMSQTLRAALPDVDTIRELAQLLKAVVERNAHEAPTLDLGEMLFCLAMYIQYRVDEEGQLPVFDEESFAQRSRDEGARALFRLCIDFAEAAYAASLAEMSDNCKRRVLESGAGLDDDKTALQLESYTLVSSPEGPAYFLGVIHAERKILLSVRGTASLHDALADLRLTCTRFLHGYAHEGMLELARKLLATIDAPLQRLRDAHPDYEVLITGHSLGAGIASILTLIFVAERRWRSGFRTVLFAAPACVTKSLAETPLPIISLVFACDLIPTLSEHNLMLLLRELHDFSREKQHHTIFSRKMDEFWARSAILTRVSTTVRELGEQPIVQNIHGALGDARQGIVDASTYLEQRVYVAGPLKRAYLGLRDLARRAVQSLLKGLRSTSPFKVLSLSMATRVVILPLLGSVPMLRDTYAAKFFTLPHRLSPFLSAKRTFFTFLAGATVFEIWKMHAAKRLETHLAGQKTVQVEDPSVVSDTESVDDDADEAGVQVLYSPAKLFWLREFKREATDNEEGGEQSVPELSDDAALALEKTAEKKPSENVFIMSETAPTKFDRIRFSPTMVGDHLLNAYRRGMDNLVADE